MILGTGAFSREVLKHSPQTIKSLSNIDVPTQVKSTWRIPAIISKQAKNLSDLYHGVTPLSSFERYSKVNLRDKIVPQGAVTDFNLAWRNPPRSIKYAAQQHTVEFETVSTIDQPVYCCLSVVPNLAIAQLNGDLIDSTVALSDHLIIPLGSIAKKEARAYSPIRTSYGPLHPVINYKNQVQISVRPKVDRNFFRLISQDFRLRDFRNIDMTKILAALYLRYGYDIAFQYEVVAQILVRECYAFNTKTKEIREIAQRANVEKVVQGITDRVASNFVSFKAYDEPLGATLPGIHLGYDRKVLRLDSNIKYLDTSLSVDERHPTIEALYQVKHEITS